MSDRVGQLFFIDHGSGHVSYRLVVGSQPGFSGPPLWQVVVFSHHARGPASRVDGSRLLSESELLYWDQMAALQGSNISRVL